MAWTPRAPGVSGVDEGDVAYADVLGLLDGEVHGGASEDDGESLVGVDNGGSRGLSEDAPPGIRLDATVAVALDVYLDHVGDAVALDAPEVGGDKGLDGGIDVAGRLSHLGEDGGEGAFEGLVGDADLVSGGYFEAFEHFCIFCIGGWSLEGGSDYTGGGRPSPQPSPENGRGGRTTAVYPLLPP